ncbi:MAG: DMT family transporter [Desulfobacteraceae bacterium]|nr:DMT family transporter [Desulfobacteraceae bacterium]
MSKIAIIRPKTLKFNLKITDHKNLQHKIRIDRWVGCFFVLSASTCFYLSSATIRWARHYVDTAPAYFVFMRFLLGFIIVCTSLIVKRRSLNANNYVLLIGRAVANTIAVYCFYKAVRITTVAEANILNMTYPVFVAIFAWFFLKKQRNKLDNLCVLIAFAGIYLILGKGQLAIGLRHLWGLASGIGGALAILFLNASRRYHDTETILFYLFGLGTISSYSFFHQAIHWPNAQEVYYLMLCSGLAIAGQYCITFGHRFVTAVEGSIIASSRIPIAACLGPFIAADPFLTIYGWIGTGLIFAVNIFLALQKPKSTPHKATGSAS